MLANDGLSLELTVKVEKEKLLGMLRENLEKHEKEHAEARAGWRRRIAKQLEVTRDMGQVLLDLANSDDAHWEELQTKHSDMEGLLVPKDWHDEPVSFAKQYKDAIEMLEIAADEEIVLSRTLYRQLVQDDWSWKTRHVMSMQKYI